MPITPTYPGVYIEEIPSGVRTITGVATSITALVGRTRRGPDNEPFTINSFADFERTFGGLWEHSTVAYALRDFYRNGGSQAIVVRLFHPSFDSDEERQDAYEEALEDAQTAAGNVAEAARTAAGEAGADADSVADAAEEAAGTPADPGPAATEAAEAAAPVTRAQLSVDTLDLEARYPGTWGNELRARVDDDVADPGSGLFNLSILDGETGDIELFRNVSVDASHPRRVDKVLEAESKLVRALGELPPDPPESNDDVEPGGNPFSDDTSIGVEDSGVPASDGKDLVAADFTGAGMEAGKLGLFALEKADLFNILCIPPYSRTEDIGSDLWADAAAYCERRRAMLLVDAPGDWESAADARDNLGTDIGLTSKNGAIFFPRLRQPDPARDNRPEDFAPCGAVAGVFARTDTERGVWKAPAGLGATLVGVPELTVPLTDAENGMINPLGINALRTLPAAGRVVWGSRTLQGDDRLASEWKYVPVRRLALYIEESLYRGTQWVVFEPNDEPLWAQIRLNIGAFMQNLFRQGAFQGKSPQEAYFVKADSESTTQNDINLGVVNIIVGFAPLKPAEFVIIKIQQMAGQIAV
ncbi:MAG TPA: phage tail sheath C-terminal domain-containing protein [Rubrobacter sp.]|nr:phage tail sheath C-terminal domain-containing protein [Rubrobacter sp.]